MFSRKIKSPTIQAHGTISLTVLLSRTRLYIIIKKHSISAPLLKIIKSPNAISSVFISQKYYATGARYYKHMCLLPGLYGNNESVRMCGGFSSLSEKVQNKVGVFVLSPYMASPIGRSGLCHSIAIFTIDN